MAWFRRKGGAPPVEKMELRGLFFLSSIVLVALTYWMLYDEVRPRRPWKDYQIEFNRLEHRMVRDELQEARAALAAREDEVKALEGELRRAEAAGAGPEMQQLLARKAELEQELAPASERVTFTKASLDEALYEVEKALYEKGGDRADPAYVKAKGRADAIEKRLKAIEPTEAKLTQELEAVEAKIRERQAAAQKVRDKLAELRAPVVGLERRLEGIQGRIPEIHQVIIEGLDINEFRQPVARVDRCMTCHVGASRAGFEREKLAKYGVPDHLLKVFMTHPAREVLIGKHPTDRLGCSACHQGQPPALEVDDAHATVLRSPPPASPRAQAGGAEAAAAQAVAGGGDARVTEKTKPAAGHLEEKHFYWERPLLRGEMVQASCRRCHAEEDVVPLAPVYSQGRALVADLGCFGCHNLRGFEKAEKVGPDLAKLRNKVDPSWLVGWIKNPTAYRPDTKMPLFKNGPGDRDLMTDDQVTGIAAYLLKASADDPEQRGAYKGGSAEKGRELVRVLGCLGCHRVESLPPPAPPAAAPPGQAAAPVAEAKAESTPAPLADEKAAAQARVAALVAVKLSPSPGNLFGPDLSRIAGKVNGDWLYRWLLNPRRYDPKTKMPNLRLTEQEAADITAFLMALGRKTEVPGLAGKLRDEAYAREGERLIRKRGCFGCHNIPGFEAAEKIAPDLTTFGTKRLLELFFGEAVHVKQTWEDFTYHKLLNPQVYQTERVEQIMPNFGLTPEQVRALRVFLKAQTDDPSPKALTRVLSEADQSIQEGRRLIRKYNCDGCHSIEGQGGVILAYYEQINLAPPPLIEGHLQEGEKVQSTWLYEWLARPTKVRPWLQVRMPTFGFTIEEATGLAKYFGALAGVRLPYEFVLAREIPPEDLRAGKLLASKDYYDCFSCHVQGDKNPEGSPESWAPDLALARYRLRPAWVEKWLRDPQRIQPGTKMPSFFTDPEGIPDDILRDPKDPDKRKQMDRQIRALMDYVMTLGER